MDGKIAERVWYPAFEFTKVGAVLHGGTPQYQVKVQCTFNGRLVPNQQLVNFSILNFSQIQMSAEHEARIETQKTAQSIAGSVTVDIDPATLKPTISPSIKTAVELNGTKWAEASVSATPMSVTVTYTPRAASWKAKHGTIQGEFSLEITVTRQNKIEQTQEIPVSQPVRIKAKDLDGVILLVGMVVLIVLVIKAPVLGLAFAAAAFALGIITEEEYNEAVRAGQKPSS